MKEISKEKPAIQEKEKSPQEDRIVLLSDGVFAIAMTLLVLDIRLPEGLDHTQFQDALSMLVPKVISYIISFVMIAVYWQIHRRIIHHLKSIDGSFIRINLILLFFVTALPIPTTFAIQQTYSDPFKLSTIIYALALTLCGLSLAALWLNATWKHRLVDPALEQDMINYFLLRSLVAPLVFLLSLVFLLFPVDTNFVYYSWFVLYPIFRLMRILQPRLFPRATELSE